jgi:hypothetical protein
MKVKAYITQKSTGETRAYAVNWDDTEGASTWGWAEGNYGCDCNRSLFFQYAKGIQPDDAEEAPCGEGAYSVKIMTSDGRILFEDTK